MHESMKRLYEAARVLRGAEIPAEVARLLGESQQTLKNWEGRGISKGGLLKAQEVIGCRAEWVSSGTEPMTTGRSVATNEPTPSYALEPVAVWDDDTPLDDDEVEVPFYKEVEFAAGSGKAHALEINGRRVRYGKTSLRSAGIDPATAACAKNSGNSMEPLIQDGSMIGIDRAKTQIVDGEIYALDHDGMLRVKYVYRLPGGGLRLRSFNSDEHPDETYGAEEAKNIKILGWVWTWSPPIRKWKGR